jgi:hypothetical protein
MAIRRYRSDFPNIFSNDDFAWVDEWLNPLRATWTCKGQWVDPEKYEIRPKESYKQTLIEAKQKELDLIEETRKRLEKELKELKG